MSRAFPISSIPSLHPFPPKSTPIPSLLFRPQYPIFSPVHKYSQIRRRFSPHPLKIKSSDTTKLPANSHSSRTLIIAIIGFGNFGQFLAKTFTYQGHNVLAHSRSDYSTAAAALGVSFFSDADDLCEQHPDVVVLCTSIISTDKVLTSLPLQRLYRNTLFVDVLSVKEYPRDLFLKLLPASFDLLCTHPMFGPESSKVDGWKGKFFVYDKIRVGSEASRVSRCEKFLSIFEKEGCRMVQISCAEHDQYAAGSQFMTHTVGRLLGMVGSQPTPMNTRGFETLLDLMEKTNKDSLDLYYGLFIYNKYAPETLERLVAALTVLKKELFRRLQDE